MWYMLYYIIYWNEAKKKKIRINVFMWYKFENDRANYLSGNREMLGTKPLKLEGL